MKKWMPLAAVFGLAGLLAGVAHAQVDATGYYAYLSTGRTQTDRKAEVDASLINAGVAPGALSSKADDKDTGWKLQAGYRINRYLAVEGGYADLGSFIYDATATAPVATRHGDIKTDGWNIDLVGYLPFTDSVTGFGRLGAYRYDTNLACSGTGIACSNPSRSKKGTSTHYGLGVDWTFARSWFARFEYEVYTRVGEAFNANGTTGTTRADVKMGSVGVGYRF